MNAQAIRICQSQRDLHVQLGLYKWSVSESCARPFTQFWRFEFRLWCFQVEVDLCDIREAHFEEWERRYFNLDTKGQPLFPRETIERMAQNADPREMGCAMAETLIRERAAMVGVELDKPILEPLGYGHPFWEISK